MEDGFIRTDNIGTDDNRCELEIWMDEHKNSDYDYDSITNIDGSQLKWATEERKRINCAHNTVIPEIQKIINTDIHWKKKYRTQLPCVNYLGLLPSEMKDLDKYELEGHYADILKCFTQTKPKPRYGDDGRLSNRGAVEDGHYLNKYNTYVHFNRNCIGTIGHFWGSNINNRNNIRLAERIEACNYDIKTINYNIDKRNQKLSSLDDNQSRLVSKVHNMNYRLENIKPYLDSQLNAQNKLFVTQLVFNNRFMTYESDMLDKISGVEMLCFNTINSIESKLTSRLSAIDQSLADMLLEFQNHYEKTSLKINENEIKLNANLNDIQIKNNKVIAGLELKLQNITESFSRKVDNCQVNVDALTKRQNFMYFIITIACVYYIYTNILYIQFN